MSHGLVLVRSRVCRMSHSHPSVSNCKTSREVSLYFSTMSPSRAVGTVILSNSCDFAFNCLAAIFGFADATVLGEVEDNRYKCRGAGLLEMATFSNEIPSSRPA